MGSQVAFVLVAAAGVFLLGVGVLALGVPHRAKSFLLGFAETPAKHYLEVGVRLVIGAAFVVAAPRMVGSAGLSLAGWALVGTSALMLLTPWHVHRAFAQRAVPRALAYLPLIGFTSLAGGAAIIWCVYASSAA